MYGVWRLGSRDCGMDLGPWCLELSLRCMEDEMLLAHLFRRPDWEKSYDAPMSPPASDSKVEKAQWFATTHWSVVMAAKQGGSSQAAAALEKLCRA